MRHLDVERVPAHEGADLFGVIFIHPRLEFAPPQCRAGSTRCVRGGRLHWRGDRRVSRVKGVAVAASVDALVERERRAGWG